MFCHAKLLGLAGGFVGVDVFLVISGYVVTLSITRQQDAGRFTLSGFYARRLKRLLPPLYLVVLATLVFCLLFNFAENNFKLIKNLGFMILFGSNFFLAKQTGYFDVESEKQPLLHTWSLSVEEQFYFILPLCLIFLKRYQPRTRAIALFAAFCAALVFSVVHTNKVGVTGYYYLPARLFEFLFGVVVALGLGRLARIPSYGGDILLLLGLGILAACGVSYGPQTIMPGTAAILPCAAAALLIVGGRRAGALQPVLSNAPLRYLGRISYSLYLWHWPVLFAFNRAGLDNGAWKWMAMALSLVLAALTHEFVETPWRARKERVLHTWLKLWVAPFLFVLALYGLARCTDNFTLFYPQAYRTDYANAGQSVFDDPRADKCWRKVEISPAAECTLGNPDAPLKAVLWGDSHAYHQIDFIDAIGKAKNIAIHDVAFSMCAPIGNSPEQAGELRLQRYVKQCKDHDIEVMKYILGNPEIKLVFMSAAWRLYQHPAGEEGRSPHGYGVGELEAELGATIERLNAAGKRVVLLDDIPLLPDGMENCASDPVYLPWAKQGKCSYGRAFAAQDHKPTGAMLARITKAHPGSAVINTHDVLCDESQCHAEIGGIPLYRHDDRDHLGASGSAMFHGLYMQKHPDQLDRIFGPDRG